MLKRHWPKSKKRKRPSTLCSEKENPSSLYIAQDKLAEGLAKNCAKMQFSLPFDLMAEDTLITAFSGRTWPLSLSLENQREIFLRPSTLDLVESKSWRIVFLGSSSRLRMVGIQSKVQASRVSFMSEPGSSRTDSWTGSSVWYRCLRRCLLPAVQECSTRLREGY